MSFIAAAALALCACAAPASAQPDSDHWDARVTAVSGDVVVHPADGGDESAAEAGMPLEEGDRVTTAAGASADISLDGGSLFSLQENSDFTLEKTAKSESSFSLALGSLLAKIQKLGDESLSVRTPTAVAAVRGTEFGVDAEGESASHVGVFDEGRVEVTGTAGGTEVLTANQETSVASGRRPERATRLLRFAARRAAMRAQIGRLAAVHRNWRRLGPAQRRALRRKSLARLRARRRVLRRRAGRAPLRPERRADRRLKK